MNDQDTHLFERARANLADAFQIAEIPVLDCPIFLAAAFPTAPEITGLKPRLPAGRGLTINQAMLSAAAEATELLALLAPSKSPAPTGNAPVQVFATRLADGAKIAVPAQQVFLDWAHLQGETLICDADSSGCAAGVDLDDATARAILECVERDAFALWWYGRQSRHHIALSAVDQIHPRLSWWLENRSRQTCLINITSDLGIPVFAAVSCESNGATIAIGTAAHANPQSAILAALTEMIQTEASMTMAATFNSPELLNWKNRVNLKKMNQFSCLQTILVDFKQVGSVQQKLTNEGFNILRVELTRPGDAFSTARIIMPNLCAMNRRFSVNRILQQNQAHPEYGGASRVEDLETFEPY